MAAALWFPAVFLLTVLIEWAVLAWFSKLGFARTGWFCFCINGLTWGCFMGVLTLFNLSAAPKGVTVIVGEVAVIVAEALLLRWFWEWRTGRAFACSLLMNLTSWLIGSSIVLFIASRL
jgi:hypothetical protein